MRARLADQISSPNTIATALCYKKTDADISDEYLKSHAAVSTITFSIMLLSLLHAIIINGGQELSKAS